MSYGIELLTLGERDGWTCWVCAGEVSPEAVAGSPHAGSVDHVIPRARGGTNDPANLRLAHRSCNGRRGSDVPELEWPRTITVYDPAPLWTAARRAQRRAGDWELVGAAGDDDAGRLAHWLRDALISIFGGQWEIRLTPLSSTAAVAGVQAVALRTPPHANGPRHRGQPARRKRSRRLRRSGP